MSYLLTNMWLSTNGDPLIVATRHFLSFEKEICHLLTDMWKSDGGIIIITDLTFFQFASLTGVPF